VITRDNLSV
jgi:regulator of protease activity HflC (stomatin/prohibitin superfamily)